MVFTHEVKTNVLVDLAKVAKLCQQHGLPGWAKTITSQLMAKVRNYQEPDGQNPVDALQGKGGATVETFELMFCNELSRYIDVMPLDRDRIHQAIPPFEYLNHLVIAHLAPIEQVVFHMLKAKNLSRVRGHRQCLKSGVPLEYLHTIIHAYHNKSLLLGFILGIDDGSNMQDKLRDIDKRDKRYKEYERLCNRTLFLYEQYTAYPSDEIDRVCRYYTRNCWGRPYDPEAAAKMAEQALQANQQEQ
ncbi:MAG: hypothetical protein K2Y22_06525 [Candidatus Obscuribacterales bacterium]|nr:hypothetical protein [Candidatus Obscuribacterales bacterium]